MTEMYPRIGDVIAEKYRVEQKLGGGGMGTVFSATHLMTGRRFAIKWMNKRAVDDSAARERFIREFQAAGSIVHANVAAALDVGTHDGYLFIVMEYLAGESLAARIARGPLTPAECVPIVVAAMRGVAAAHRLDIVHRDLKPANIFICQSPGRSDLDVKVLDFGVMKAVNARANQLPTITAHGVAVGTPPYMAPEQVLALRSIDHRVDVYAFGVILYEALSGRVPYVGDTGMRLLERIVRGEPPALSEVARGIPIGLQATVMRALRRDPRQRFQGLDEFAACLSPWAADGDTHSRRDHQLPPSIPTPEPVASEVRVSAPPDPWGPLSMLAEARTTTGTLLTVKPRDLTISPDAITEPNLPRFEPHASVPPAAALLSARLASITRAPGPMPRMSHAPEPAPFESREARVEPAPAMSPAFALAATLPASIAPGGKGSLALAPVTPPQLAPMPDAWLIRPLGRPSAPERILPPSAASVRQGEIWSAQTQFVQALKQPALRSHRGLAIAAIVALVAMGALVALWPTADGWMSSETAENEAAEALEQSVEAAIAAPEPLPPIELPQAEPRTETPPLEPAKLEAPAEQALIDPPLEPAAALAPPVLPATVDFEQAPAPLEQPAPLSLALEQPAPLIVAPREQPTPLIAPREQPTPLIAPLEQAAPPIAPREQPPRLLIAPLEQPAAPEPTPAEQPAEANTLDEARLQSVIPDPPVSPDHTPADAPQSASQKPPVHKTSGVSASDF